MISCCCSASASTWRRRKKSPTPSNCWSRPRGRTNSTDTFEVVLDAKIDPEKYHLEFQMKSELEKHQRTTFEAIGQVFLDAKRPDRAIVALERAAKAKKTKPGNIAFSLAQAYLMTANAD